MAVKSNAKKEDMDWAQLAATSQHQTAVAVRDELYNENIAEAARGLEELIESLARSDKRALRSQLTRLMAHIIKWQIQPERRSRSWLASITNARIEIAAILEDEPGQQRNLVDLWQKCFVAARTIARDETGVEPQIDYLTEAQVFELRYTLEE
jgi:hypothetical protein